jgi:sugar-specific transcriptional regulator TrmB
MNNLDNRQRLSQFLSKLNFEKNEINIYLTLNNYGYMTIAELSKTSDVPRTSVTRNIEKLIKKGVISKKTKNGQTKYVAESPENLNSLLNLEESSLRTKLSQINTVQNELNEIMEIFKLEKKQEKNEAIEVKYYEGKKGFLDASDRTLDFAGDEVLFYSNHEKWRKVYDIEYDLKYYVPKRVAKKIKNRSLVIRNKLGKELKESSDGKLRQVKYLPATFDFDTTFIIYKDNVSIMISDKPYTAINIKSKAVYKTFTNLFNNLWNTVGIE